MLDHFPTYQRAIAQHLGCEAEDLLAFRWDEEDHEFVVLAPDGSKHRYDFEQLAALLAADAHASAQTTPADPFRREMHRG
jgi:hypothetical protein